MGNSRSKDEELLYQRHVALQKSLNKWQIKYLKNIRQETEAHAEQLHSLASHVLSDNDIKESSRIAVLSGMSLREMKRAYTLFSRMSSTTERFCTVHEISLYFNLRRTVLLETCLTHVYPGKERLSLPQYILTMMAFCTCDHWELIRVVTDYCAARNESSLESLMIAIHGAPFEGKIESLLTVLQNLKTVHVDVTRFDRQANRAVADVEKLVKLNEIYPSLLYPSFKLQAGLKEKFLGNSFWNRTRQKLGAIGLHGMFSRKDWETADLNHEVTALYKRRRDVMVKSQCNELLPKMFRQGKSSHQKLMDILDNIENFRPYKSASVVDMDADDSQGLAWEITCTALAKTAAVEVVLDDEEKEAIEMEAHYKEFGGRKQIPGDPILWIQLTEGIYDPKMWRWMSDQGGYSITQRIKQGCQSFSERAAKQNIGVSKLLRDLAKSGQDKDGDGETDALALDPATLRAKAEAEQRAEDSKLEEIQRNHWDLFWRSFLDPRTQRPIYFNFLTGERRWTKPRGMSRIARRITQRRARQRKHSLIQIEDDQDDDDDDDDNSSGNDTEKRASPPSLKEQGLTPKERKRLARSQSLNSAQFLIDQNWGVAASEKKERKHQRQLLGSIKPRRVKQTAAGEIDESVDLYEGNNIAVVVGASMYKIVTERATITRVNVPKLNLIVIKKAKMGYQKKRKRKATAAELKKQKKDTTYDVMYDLDGFPEKGIPRVRLIAF